ncbi:MAG: Gldg family protein [Drouetiella hepatica Uher 2000/2452]|jgi:ABC-type uncharacterized transport system involved in gliding motility auxiliary subunit|uniref:Gldg family protein n=1 Tax=Drouetiella hepatica Uher 2000/2452 TaxID=904376 RepID=A0A951UKE4_9CYAN|nr:Gldg family protein [Drouetiella hepatica Uher 2000/2452]
MKKVQTFNWKLLKYLFWFGPVLIVMGLTSGSIAGWGVVPTALIVAGLAVTAVWLFLESSAHPGFWRARSTQVGTNALLATLAMLAIVGMVNVLAVRYPGRIDLTENRIFTLAPQSQEVVQSLTQPVKVWVFSPNANPVDRELLENYRRRSSQFSYEFVDPQAKPGVAKTFNVQSIGEVYLETGGNRRFVQSIASGEALSERRLTNGLAQLSSTQQQKIYFLQGHGERIPEATGKGGMSAATGKLKEVSYVPLSLNLVENPKVPDDASVVVVAGAQRPLLDKELEALRTYASGKGGLLLLVDPQTDPNLDTLLSDWGIRVSDRLVIDPAGQASGLGPGVTIVNQYGDHPITRGFGKGISFYPLARPLETSKIAGIDGATLLYTSDRTTAQQIDETGELKFDSATDPKGPFSIGMALTRSTQPTPTPSPSPSPTPSPSPSPTPSPSPSPASPQSQFRLVVIGNSSFATDGLFEQQLNGDLFLNATTWLSQRDDEVLSIRPREVTNRRVVLSPEQVISVALISMLLLPLVGFGTATAVWWKRR